MLDAFGKLAYLLVGVILTLMVGISTFVGLWTNSVLLGVATFFGIIVLIVAYHHYLIWQDNRRFGNLSDD